MFYKTDLLEIIFIIITIIIFWYYRLNLPIQISLANLILYLSALLLLQSLIRDLSILLIQKQKQEQQKSSQLPCMCVESTVGLTGILLGAGFIGLGISDYINMTPIAWIASIASVLIIGFLIKDLVFQWNPWRIYIEKDHLNIVFSWKK